MPQIGSYDIGKELGRGGVGVVYEVHHKATNARYALKILLKATELQRKRFEQEAQNLTRLTGWDISTIREKMASNGQAFEEHSGSKRKWYQKLWKQ